MTSSEFKKQFLPLFENAHYFDDALIAEYRKQYLELCGLPAFDTVKKFAEFYFKSWKPETHSAWLKRGKEKRDYMAECRARAAKKMASKPRRITDIKIRKFTPKRAKIEREYEKAKAEILEERPHQCAGCHRTDCRLTFSHRIPRSERKDLIAEKSNIDLMCDETGNNCHSKVETFRWDELANGEEIKRYIKQVQPERYWIYHYKNKAV